MADRPHSRNVKVEEGTAEVRKGEKLSSDTRASERKTAESREENKKTRP